MWFDGIRQPNTMYVASVSRGKDSTAMLRAIQLMGWPLDAIVAVDIWATQDIPAELPPMVAFKDEWDRKCLENFGVPVTRLCAKDKDGNKISYQDIFYRRVSPERERERERRILLAEAERGQRDLRISSPQRFLVSERFKTNTSQNGFPAPRVPWCTNQLKQQSINKRALVGGGQFYGKATTCKSLDFRYKETLGATPSKQEKSFSPQPQERGAKINIVHYIGIAQDEPERIARHMPTKNKVMPLVQIGWDEALCGLEAQYYDMLAPTYTTSMRDGCWFCHKQGVEQLRKLRRNYPDLWQLLLKWDSDSPVTYHADGHTVHDFDKRFEMEDQGLVPTDRKFKWGMVDGSVPVQISIDDILEGD